MLRRPLVEGPAGLSSAGVGTKLDRTSGGELQLAAAYRTALRHFVRRTEAAAAQAELTPERYDLLLMIAAAADAGAEATVSELKHRLALRQQAVTELVKRAEEAGLVERERAVHDGRVFHLHLTAEGEARVAHVVRALRSDRASVAAAFHELDAHFRASLPSA